MRIGFGVVPMVCFLLLSTTAFGQHFSYGVVGGTALTDDFESYLQTFSLPGMQEPISEIQSNGRKGFIIGPTVEWSFTRHFSFEADALYRELRFLNNGSGPQQATVTWEIPILAKYRFGSYEMGHTRFRPFVETGPSYRSTGNLNANPTHFGFSAGGGLDLRVRKFDIAPALRYTRWTTDASPYEIHSKTDQLELLVGFNYSSGTDGHPFGTRLSIGGILGTNLLGDYSTNSFTATNVLDGSQITNTSSSGPRSFIIGPVVEIRLTRGFSLETDAIHRPVQQNFTQTGSGIYSSSLTTWQIPVLAKYQLPWQLLGKTFRPFIEAGPSFRIPPSFSHYGATTGLGVSARFHGVTVSPAIRYSRWRATPLSGLKQDEADVFVGFTF